MYGGIDLARYRSLVSLCVLCALIFLLPTAARAEKHHLFDEEAMYRRLDSLEREQYAGLHYLLSDHQKRQYLSLETRGEREEWLERFWRMIR